MGGYRHPDLAHVAHHEAVNCVEHIVGHLRPHDRLQANPRLHLHPPAGREHGPDREGRGQQGHEIKIGKFPFSASGRALAAGETEGFVKLIFDAKYGELLGVHMIGENVTELLAELVLARKLEATEAEIIEAMHPHPTMSEAIMEAAGVADGQVDPSLSCLTRGRLTTCHGGTTGTRRSTGRERIGSGWDTVTAAAAILLTPRPRCPCAGSTNPTFRLPLIRMAESADITLGTEHLHWTRDSSRSR